MASKYNIDDITSMPINSLLDILPELLEDLQISNGVVERLCERISTLHDVEEDLSRLLEVIAENLVPSPSTSEKFVELLVRCDRVQVLLPHLARLIGPSSQEQRSLIIAYSDLLQKDRQFIVPILSSLSRIEIVSEFREAIFDLTREGLKVSNSADFPILMKSLLRNLTSANTGEAVSLIRKEISKLFESCENEWDNTCLAVFTDLSSSLFSNQHFSAVFAKSIETSQILRRIDLVVVIALMSGVRPSDNSKAFILFQSLVKSRVLSFEAFRDSLLCPCQSSPKLSKGVFSLCRQLLTLRTENVSTVGILNIAKLANLGGPSSKSKQYSNFERRCRSWGARALTYLFGFPTMCEDIIKFLCNIICQYRLNVSPYNYELIVLSLKTLLQIFSSSRSSLRDFRSTLLEALTSAIELYSSTSTTNSQTVSNRIFATIRYLIQILAGLTDENEEMREFIEKQIHIHGLLEFSIGLEMVDQFYQLLSSEDRAMASKVLLQRLFELDLNDIFPMREERVLTSFFEFLYNRSSMLPSDLTTRVWNEFLPSLLDKLRLFEDFTSVVSESKESKEFVGLFDLHLETLVRLANPTFHPSPENFERARMLLRSLLKFLISYMHNKEKQQFLKRFFLSSLNILPHLDNLEASTFFESILMLDISCLKLNFLCDSPYDASLECKSFALSQFTTIHNALRNATARQSTNMETVVSVMSSILLQLSPRTVISLLSQLLNEARGSSYEDVDNLTGLARCLFLKTEALNTLRLGSSEVPLSDRLASFSAEIESFESMMQDSNLITLILEALLPLLKVSADLRKKAALLKVSATEESEKNKLLEKRSKLVGSIIELLLSTANTFEILRENSREDVSESIYQHSAVAISRHIKKSSKSLASDSPKDVICKYMELVCEHCEEHSVFLSALSLFEALTFGYEKSISTSMILYGGLRSIFPQSMNKVDPVLISNLQTRLRGESRFLRKIVDPISQFPSFLLKNLLDRVPFYLRQHFVSLFTTVLDSVLEAYSFDSTATESVQFPCLGISNGPTPVALLLETIQLDIKRFSISKTELTESDEPANPYQRLITLVKCLLQLLVAIASFDPPKDSAVSKKAYFKEFLKPLSILVPILSAKFEYCVDWRTTSFDDSLPEEIFHLKHLEPLAEAMVIFVARLEAFCEALRSDAYTSSAKIPSGDDYKSYLPKIAVVTERFLNVMKTEVASHHIPVKLAPILKNATSSFESELLKRKEIPTKAHYSKLKKEINSLHLQVHAVLEELCEALGWVKFEVSLLGLFDVDILEDESTDGYDHYEDEIPSIDRSAGLLGEENEGNGMPEQGEAVDDFSDGSDEDSELDPEIRDLGYDAFETNVDEEFNVDGFVSSVRKRKRASSFDADNVDSFDTVVVDFSTPSNDRQAVPLKKPKK